MFFPDIAWGTPRAMSRIRTIIVAAQCGVGPQIFVPRSDEHTVTYRNKHRGRRTGRDLENSGTGEKQTAYGPSWIQSYRIRETINYSGWRNTRRECSTTLLRSSGSGMLTVSVPSNSRFLRPSPGTLVVAMECVTVSTRLIR